MRFLLAAASVAILATSTPALADGHKGMDHSAGSADDHALHMVLMDERRADDRARDAFRHPAETLDFFQVEPDMTVVEWGPGGGWYTRVLAPWLMPSGKYVALNGDSDAVDYPNRAAEARSKGWTETFKGTVAEAMGIKAGDVAAYEIDEIPDEAKGTADRVLIFRSMHGMWNNDLADTTLAAVRGMLKDDGMVGVVQHRAPADASWSDVNPARGYMRQADVVKLFELHGFELVGSSEINANPKDPANWEGGVWTLPPVLRYGDEDRAKYEAIGESDRMTLLFKKAM
uniref:class I SAM-dependent methyltransferase n=1 Tax=Parerythrobacter lutipelagi TaxID=1964208 RepID=UPI0010F86347|nr:class I SAM-dependent methyltransferase [Parerythrobacter lutipelagi]